MQQDQPKPSRRGMIDYSPWYTRQSTSVKPYPTHKPTTTASQRYVWCANELINTDLLDAPSELPTWMPRILPGPFVPVWDKELSYVQLYFNPCPSSNTNTNHNLNPKEFNGLSRLLLDGNTFHAAPRPPFDPDVTWNLKPMVSTLNFFNVFVLSRLHAACRVLKLYDSKRAGLCSSGHNLF